MQAIRSATDMVGRIDRSLERRLGLRLAALRCAAELDLPELTLSVAQADRREHGVGGPLPAPELALEQVAALVDRRERALVNG
jgi:hypothetical protein